MFTVFTNFDRPVSTHDTLNEARIECSRLEWEATASPVVGVRFCVDVAPEDCECDGSDDYPFTCEGHVALAEDSYYYSLFSAAKQATNEGIAAHKDPDYTDSIIDRIDEGRI